MAVYLLSTNKHRKMKIYSIIVLLLIVAGCKKNNETKIVPACVQSAIDSSLSMPKGSYYHSIAEYRYHNKTVYLYVPGCCDRFSSAYDETCKYLFSPSGGITGCGDCEHPDFFNEAIFIRTVWEDPRP